jgi:hypothetical protein
MSDESSIKLALERGVTGLEFLTENDPVLDALEREFHQLAGNMGAPGTKGAGELPVDVEVVKPLAFDLRRIFALRDKAMGAGESTWKDVLGQNRVPILVRHGVTPFFAPGARPRAVYALGYQATIEEDAETIDVAPTTQMLEVGSIDQQVTFSLSSGGKFDSVSSPAADMAKIAGIELPSVELGASVSNQAELRIRLKLELLKSQAAPVGAGGARWNLYRQDETLVGFTPLVQTMLVSPATQSLTFKVFSWAKFGGFLGIGAQKATKEQTFTVSIARP